jgi:hypothetical protein
MGNVSSVFSKSAPDPAEFEKQKAVNAQLQIVIKDLSGTIGLIDAAITSAAGFSTTLSNLAMLKQRAIALRSAAPNMTPVDIETKRGAIEAELKILQASITKKADISSSDDRGLAVSQLRDRVREVVADPNVSAKMKKEFSDYSATVDLSGGITASAIRGKLSSLNRDADIDRYKDFVFTRMFKFSASIAFVVLYYATLTLSILFGGIIVSNMYFEEDFWAGRLFYFVYGMAFFPISLLVGIIKPPPWVAAIMPLFNKALESPRGPEDPGNPLYNAIGSPLFGYNAVDAQSGSRWPMRVISIILAILFSLFTYMRGLGAVKPATPAAKAV